MITIICGTNRPQNNTSIIVKAYADMLKSKGNATQILWLEDLPADFIFKNEVLGGASDKLKKIAEQYIEKPEKLVIISPEYNGGFPGVLKSFIDSIVPQLFENKKIALVGVASGRAGNLRGMDQLTNILHYLKAHVLPLKVPVSSINKLIDEHELTDESTREVLTKQIDQFLAF
jgi:NAD(P)H-dependent FMN reductase